MAKENSPLVIDVKFSNTITGNLLHDVNYDIIVMQNDEIALSQLGTCAKNGESQHTTASLSTDSHVRVMTNLQIIGSNAPYSGPKDQMIEAEIVLEFGPMSALMLLFATSAAIGVPKMYRFRAAA